MSLEQVKIGLKSKIDKLQFNNASDLSTLNRLLDDLSKGKTISQVITKDIDLPEVTTGMHKI